MSTQAAIDAEKQEQLNRAYSKGVDVAIPIVSPVLAFVTFASLVDRCVTNDASQLIAV